MNCFLGGHLRGGEDDDAQLARSLASEIDEQSGGLHRTMTIARALAASSKLFGRAGQ